MVKHAAQTLIALCSAASVLAEGGGDVRRLLSGRKTFSVKDFGAKGDRHDDTQAIQAAFDRLETSSELRFPKGQYKFGPIHFSGLKDVKINFEKGAELFMGDMDMWKHYKADPGSNPWFKAEKCEGLELAGGIFHGDRKSWHKRHPHDPPGPNSFSFQNIKDLEVHDMEIWTAPAAHFGIKHTHGFHIHDIKMNVTDASTDNTEGVMVGDSSNGRVQRVNVFDGDDCLKVHGESSNIVFEDCVCACGHGLTVGGKENQMRVQDVKFSNIKVYGMSNGARLKMNPKAEGFVKNITWEHITMDNVRRPIHIQTDYGDEGGKGGNKFEIGDLYYTDIKATYSEHRLTGSGKPYPTQIGRILCKQKDCKKIHLKDINIDVSGSHKYYDGWVCDGGHEQVEVHNVSPDLPSSCHRHSGPSPGPKPGPRPSPSPSPSGDCQKPGESGRRRRCPNPSPSPSPSGDCQKPGESGRRRRCPSRRRSERQVEGWDLDAAERVDDLIVDEEVVDEGDDEFDEGAEDVTPKEFTV